MKFLSAAQGHEVQLIDLFTTVFAASEGEAEGRLIGGFVTRLLGDTPPDDIRVFVAVDDAPGPGEGTLIGAAIFSRLTYAEDPRTVFILSPMAIATNRHGQGVGQALLRHALDALRTDGVDVAITYGDPAFYGKTGFMPLAESVAAAPLPLSHPHGWLGQSLDGETLAPLKGGCTCVSALNDPALW